MILSLMNFSNLWGLPLDVIKSQGRSYRLKTSFVYILDIIVTIICAVYLFISNVVFSHCIFVVMLITLVSSAILSIVRNPERWRAYLFYKKFRKFEVIEMTLFVKEDNLKSILYCSNYKLYNSKEGISNLQDLMLSACREDSVYAKRLGVLLSRFTVNEEDMTEIKAYMVKKGKKYYLISFSTVNNQ